MKNPYDINTLATNAVGQGIGSGIAGINQLRADQLLANLNRQDINLEKAMSELNQLRDTVNGTLQGSAKTVHGIIAEHTQVHFSNARNYVVGKEATYVKEPDLKSPIDYWDGETRIQSKFLGGMNQDGLQTIKQTLTSEQGIAGHLKKYPNFLKEGGIYQVPKDQYEHAINILSKPSAELSRADYNTVQSIREFEQANNVKFEDVIKPSVVKYGDVQAGAIGDTINGEEARIIETDESRRAAFYDQAKATLKQGAQVAAFSAAIEGVAGFGTAVITKFKEGKRIGDFTESDWKEIFTGTAGGTLRGGVRGASVYALTNLVKVNAVAATALVTVAFGAVTATSRFVKGEITSKEYVDNLQQLGAETGVSAAGAAIGQALIPVPVVGAVVGSLAGSIILGGIQQAAMTDLQGSQFLVDIENAYAGMAEKVDDSSKVFRKSLEILALQHEDFENKTEIDHLLTDDLQALYNQI